MQPKRRKGLLITGCVIVGIFVIGLFAPKEDEKATVKAATKIEASKAPAFTSARDLVIKLKDAGISFNDPVDLDSMERLDHFQLPERLQLFYKDDTLTEATFFTQIKENRKYISSHLDDCKLMVTAIDSEAGEWLADIIAKQDPKKPLEAEKDINNRHYDVTYDPAPDFDAFNITVTPNYTK